MRALPRDLVHGVSIGKTRIASKGGDGEPDGTITSFAPPYFRVTFDNGKVKSLRGHVLAQLICWRDKNFYDLSLWSSDYRIIQPYRIPGWSRACRKFLLQNSTFIPERFLGPPDGAGAAEGDVMGRIEQERATLRVQLNELVDKSRA